MNKLLFLLVLLSFGNSTYAQTKKITIDGIQIAFQTAERGFAVYYPQELADLIIIDPADFTQAYSTFKVLFSY